MPIKTSPTKTRAENAGGFDAYVDSLTHDWMKILILLASVLIPLFFVLDYFTVPEELLFRFGAYRAAATVLILIVYAVLRLTKPSWITPLHGYGLSIPVGFMITLMTVNLGGFDSSYYAGLNLVIIAIGLYLPWHPKHTAANCLIVLGMYAGMNAIFGGPFKTANLLNNLYFMTSTAVITFGISVVRYRNTRKEYELRTALSGAQINEIRALAEVAHVVSQGNLTVRVEKKSSDVAGVLEAAFDLMIRELRDAMVRISEVSSSLARLSSDIRESVAKIAEGAGQQLDRTAESSRVIDAMAETIIDGARRAEETSRTADLAIQTAGKTGRYIEDAAAGMDRIAGVVRETSRRVASLSRSSERIRDIVQVINDIADQTHLLALNAAIESARAGQYGKGFAVVADEVGKLAEKTADATKEITSMIGNVLADIEETVRAISTADREVDTAIGLVHKMHESMREIIEFSSALQKTVRTVTRDSGEQAEAAETIRRHIAGIYDIAVRLTESIGLIGDSVGRINTLTESLSEMVNKFTLS